MTTMFGGAAGGEDEVGGAVEDGVGVGSVEVGVEVGALSLEHATAISKAVASATRTGRGRRGCAGARPAP